jgi:hypothetical protein
MPSRFLISVVPEISTPENRCSTAKAPMTDVLPGRGGISLQDVDREGHDLHVQLAISKTKRYPVTDGSKCARDYDDGHYICDYA